MDPHDAPPAVQSATRSVTLFVAFAAFTVANLIHNDLGLDPAVAPAALFVVLYARRPRRVLHWGAALLIALPSFAFFRLSALAEPLASRPFLNHVALLLAGTLAVVSVLQALGRAPAAAPSTRGAVP